MTTIFFPATTAALLLSLIFGMAFPAAAQRAALPSGRKIPAMDTDLTARFETAAFGLG